MTTCCKSILVGLAAASFIVINVGSASAQWHPHHQTWIYELAPRHLRVRMDVLVNGQPLPTVIRNGRPTLPVEDVGQEYAIRVSNDGPRRILAIVSVDGLSVMNGQPENDYGSGYVIRPHSSTIIRGWRRGNDKVAAFSFEKRSNSYAARMGQDAKIGVIRLLAIEELNFNYPSPMLHYGRASTSAAQQPGGIGTGYGRELDSRVVGVPFRRGTRRRELKIHYDNKDVRPDVTRSAENFTTPPPGWSSR